MATLLSFEAVREKLGNRSRSACYEDMARGQNTCKSQRIVFMMLFGINLEYVSAF